MYRYIHLVLSVFECFGAGDLLQVTRMTVYTVGQLPAPRIHMDVGMRS